MIRGYIYSTLSAILFGSAGVIIKFAFGEGTDSIELLTFQYIIAVIIMFFIMLITDRTAFKIRRIDLYHAAVLGVVGNTFMTVFYYLAFSYLNVSMVAILLYTYPVMVCLYKYFFERTSIDRRKLTAFGMAFIGCFLTLNLINQNTQLSIIGITFGLLSAVFYAFMNIYSEKRFFELNPLSINFYSTAFSLLVLMLFNPPHFVLEQGINIKLFEYTTVLAVICEIIPLTLLYAAIKLIGALKVSIIGNLEIPTAMILSYFFLREDISIIQVIGAGMVIYAAYSIRNNPGEEIELG